MEIKKRLSGCRDELKGIAILWVVFFHAAAPGVNAFGNVLDTVQGIGYGGVDIFFFLMGYGLYYSLKKNPNVAYYWKRRLQRVLPSYLPLIICWIAVMFPGYGLSRVQGIRSAAGNLLMAGYWFQIPKNFNWYVSGMMLFFLLAPAIHGLLSKSKKPFMTLVVLLAVSVAVGICCVGIDQYMAISRLPIFIIGMAFAMDWKKEPNRVVLFGVSVLSFCAGLYILLLCRGQYVELLYTYGMYWHPFVLITPPLCMGLSYLFSKMEKARMLFAPIRLFGKASFEIYLVNIWMVELKADRLAFEGWHGWAVWSLCVVLGIGYHFLVQAGMAVWKRRTAG